MVDFNVSNLPKEMLDLVAEHSVSIGDYVRFRGVCSLFNSVVTEKGNFSPDTFPWLMLPQLVSANNVGTQRFFDLSEHRFYNLNWPLQVDSVCWGSPYGWVVLLHQDQVQIINPVTSNQLALPQLPVLLDHEGDPLPPFQLSFLHRVVLSVSSPAAATPAERFMVTVVSPDGNLVCAKPTYTQWRPLKMGGRPIHDVLPYNNRLYLVDELGNVTSVQTDVANPPLVMIAFPPPDIDIVDCELESILVDTEEQRKFYLVELLGEMHMVVKFQGYDYSLPPDTGFDHHQAYMFKVFKFDFKTLSWIQLSTLGDHAIFIGNNTSFSLSVSRYPECRAGSIYFTEHCIGDEFHNGKPGIYHLQSRELVSLTTEDHGVLYSPPVWFMPKLH